MPAIGLQYFKPGATFMMGAGYGIAWKDGTFTAVAVAAGNEAYAQVSTGVLLGVDRERAALLEQCNRWNQNQPAYPVYLHDAENGWTVLMHTSFPILLLETAPEFFGMLVAELPRIAARARAEFTGVGGRAFHWGADDLEKLVQSTLM